MKNSNKEMVTIKLSTLHQLLENQFELIDAITKDVKLSTIALGTILEKIKESENDL